MHDSKIKPQIKSNSGPDPERERGMIKGILIRSLVFEITIQMVVNSNV